MKNVIKNLLLEIANNYPKYIPESYQTSKHVSSHTRVLVYLCCNMSICYTKQEVMKQNTTKSLMNTLLGTSHNDTFGHILSEKPRKQSKQISAVWWLFKYISHICFSEMRFCVFKE